MQQFPRASRTRGVLGDEAKASADGVTRQQWKWTALAGMASYLDAGSIVALGAAMALFQQRFGMTDSAVGMLAAIGPNAIGCALGAFVGGWLGDKLGRKRIYQYDLLVYAAGILCIAFAINSEMLFLGTFVVGLAVGADVPTSLALVGELAPAKARENCSDSRRLRGASARRSCCGWHWRSPNGDCWAFASCCCIYSSSRWSRGRCVVG